MDKITDKSKVIYIYLALGLASLAAFWQVRNCDFINYYDDPIYVTKNKNVQEGLTIDSIRWAFTARHANNWHPLTWLSHMLDCQLFGLDAGRHHLTNLILHIANTLLLFAVFRRMTGYLWRSGFVAAAFALHPLHVESVAWVAERKDVLSTLFWLLTMWVYVRYARQQKIGWYLLVILFFVLGLMSKPMLVTLPFVLLLLDYWPLERIGKVKIAALVAEKIPLFVLSGISSAITFLVQRSGGAVAQANAISIRERIVNVPVAYVRYIGKIFWPSKLAVFYPHNADKLAMWQIIGAVLLLLVVSVLVIWLTPKGKYFLMGWLWFLGILVPVIGIVQVGLQGMANRYTYVSSIGIFVIVGWGLPELLKNWQYRKIVLIRSAAVVIIAMIVCTNLELRYWRNDFTLFNHAIEVTENNYLMHNNLGITLGSGGRLDEAIGHFNKAVEIRPSYAQAYYNMALTYQMKGYSNKAIERFRTAVQIKPDYVDAYNNLGLMLRSQGKIDEAMEHFYQALEAKEDNFRVHYNLAVTLESQGDFTKALEHYRKALKIDPKHSKSRDAIQKLLEKKSNKTE